MSEFPFRKQRLRFVLWFSAFGFTQYFCVTKAFDIRNLVRSHYCEILHLDKLLYLKLSSFHVPALGCFLPGRSSPARFGTQAGKPNLFSPGKLVCCHGFRLGVDYIELERYKQAFDKYDEVGSHPMSMNSFCMLWSSNGMLLVGNVHCNTCRMAAVFLGCRKDWNAWVIPKNEEKTENHHTKPTSHRPCMPIL